MPTVIMMTVVALLVQLITAKVKSFMAKVPENTFFPFFLSKVVGFSSKISFFFNIENVTK
jgi:hypothetical protein